MPATMSSTPLPPMKRHLPPTCAALKKKVRRSSLNLIRTLDFLWGSRPCVVGAGGQASELQHAVLGCVGAGAGGRNVSQLQPWGAGLWWYCCAPLPAAKVRSSLTSLHGRRAAAGGVAGETLPPRVPAQQVCSYLCGRSGRSITTDFRIRGSVGGGAARTCALVGGEGGEHARSTPKPCCVVWGGGGTHARMELHTAAPLPFSKVLVLSMVVPAGAGARWVPCAGHAGGRGRPHPPSSHAPRVHAVCAS